MFSTPAAGPPAGASTTTTRVGTSRPRARSAVAAATTCDSFIISVFSASTCSAVTSGGKYRDASTASTSGESHAPSRSYTVTFRPGPPSKTTVVKSRLPLVGYVVAPSMPSTGVPSTEPRTLVAGPGASVT